MTLVERFIEISNWPTSRKTLLVSGIGLPLHVISMLITHLVTANNRITDLNVVDSFAIAGTVLLATCFFVSLITVKAGKEAPWTAYMFTSLYGVFVFGMIWAFGSWSTPVFAVYPIAAIFAGLLYNEKVAVFAFFYGLACLAVGEGLQVAGVVKYAPALLDRTIDAQHSTNWVVGVVSSVMLFFIFCFVLSLLVVSARRLQDTRLQKAHQQLDRSARLIRRYVPGQVADAILSGSEETASQHERRKLTIFFSDLVGFTEIAEELEPEDLSRVLNEYFSEMTAIAQKHGGTVDELSGDAILIFFGAPQATNDKDHALRAVRMAMEMQQAMAGLNAKWQSAGITESLQVRMGINTGVVTVGNFGSPERMKYAALGKHVNLAARLQAHSEPGRVLLSHATWLLVNDQIQCALKGEMQFKGIHKPVMTYELSQS